MFVPILILLGVVWYGGMEKWYGWFDYLRTWEKLQERMEAAYRGKERMVSEELGNMRQELSREMRDIISHNHGDLSEKPVKLVN